MLLVICGVAARVVRLGAPARMTFDEFHFVIAARAYLEGTPDLNDHPPLGKLVLAAAVRLFGDSPVGWRLPLVVSGVLLIGVVGVAVARLFGDVRSGLLAAALVSADGFFISYSRLALLDGFLVLCAATAVLLFSSRLTWWRVVLVGLVCGVACSIKFSGVSLVALSLAAVVLLGRSSLRQRLAAAATIVLVAACVYFATFSVGLRLSNRTAGPAAVIDATKGLLDRHSAATNMVNPASSSWPTWFVPTKPVRMALQREDNGVRVLSSLGNLAIWWSAELLAVSLLALVLWRGVKATLVETEGASWWPSSFLSGHGRATLLLLLGALLWLAPWVLSRREPYIYHFLPTYLFFAMTLGAYLGWTARRAPMATLVFLLLTGLVFAFYEPVWTYGLVSDGSVEARFFLPGWR